MQLSTVQQFREERQKLIDTFLKGSQPDFLPRYTQTIDDYLRQSFAVSEVGPRMNLNSNPYALIALGGFGRQEQCIFSDVDLLFLFEKRVPRETEALVKEIVYPLWDAGIEVGHATRTVNECIADGKEDYEILTAMLDARFICGMSPLFSRLRERLRRKIVSTNKARVIRWLVETNQARHYRFGDSAHLLKPNLKEGQGGLRDYHTMLWIGRIEADIHGRRDLEYVGYLSQAEFETLDVALEFIWRVRNHLHHLAGRKCDQLHYEFQKKLAQTLGYRDQNGQRAVERFLGDLHGNMELIKTLHKLFMYEREIKKRHKGRKRSKTPFKFEGLQVREGMINFLTPESILQTPELLVHIFQESARLQMPLGAEAKRLVQDFTHLVDDNFRTSAPVIKSFERILVSPTPLFNVLNEMHNAGFLEAFIPEFRNIKNRILYDQYHIYPVDKHCLRVVRALKNFGTERDHSGCFLCGELFKEITSRKLMFWGALLHDIGKGLPGGGHSEQGAEIARGILALGNLKPKELDTVCFLVREHLTLIKAATRRDIQDEETALICARQIKDLQRLKMLYLLTVADSFATGPKAWNDWTATLLRGLFLKVANIIEKGELVSKKAVRTFEKKQAAILASARDDADLAALESLYNVMSPRYLLYMPVGNILGHIGLYREKGTEPFAWQVAKDNKADTRLVTICADDQPGLISNIAGVFTLNGIEILDVQVFTWRNHTALDVFTVTPPPDRVFEDEKWDKAARHLKAALGDTLDLGAALREKVSTYQIKPMTLSDQPHQIIIDNTSSSFYTIIEVHSDDFPGLLFAVADALYRCRLDIWVAKIATNADQVVDVFYVRDFDGQKVDPPTEKAIKIEIERVLADSNLPVE
jgi:[protein-PII] uridylyltransferase